MSTNTINLTQLNENITFSANDGGENITLRLNELARGATGIQGPQGPAGEQGAPGPPLVNSNTYTPFTGILKGDGTYVGEAVAGTDYLAPTGNGSGLTGLTSSQITDAVYDTFGVDAYGKLLKTDPTTGALYLQFTLIDELRVNTAVEIGSSGTCDFIYASNSQIGSSATVTMPTVSGTMALTSNANGVPDKADKLTTARNIFGISFDGTANVSGNATNAGHFASIPTGGEAGHFITLNGTAPTVIAGRSAWFSDGSGVPSFRNGTGEVVTLTYSGGPLGTPSSGTLTSCTGLPVSTGISGLGTGVATWLATPSGANLASALTTALPASKGGTGLTALGTGVATFLGTPTSANLAAAVTDETGSGSLVFATSPTITTPIIATGSTTGAFGIGGTTSSFGFLRDAGSVLGVSGSAFRNSANTADTYLRANIIATYNSSLDFSINAANAANNSTRVSINKGDLGTIQADGNGAFCWGTAGTDQRTLTPDTGLSRVSAGVVGVGTGAAGSIAGELRAATVTVGTGLNLPKTITAGGTTGAQTINKPSGSVNFAAGATSLVVTNSLCTTSSVILVSMATNDATANGLRVVAGSGSFTIYMLVAPTAETRVNFLLTN
jgi:hypothetical protein